MEISVRQAEQAERALADQARAMKELSAASDTAKQIKLISGANREHDRRSAHAVAGDSGHVTEHISLCATRHAPPRCLRKSPLRTGHTAHACERAAARPRLTQRPALGTDEA